MADRKLRITKSDLTSGGDDEEQGEQESSESPESGVDQNPGGSPESTEATDKGSGTTDEGDVDGTASSEDDQTEVLEARDDSGDEPKKKAAKPKTKKGAKGSGKTAKSSGKGKGPKKPKKGKPGPKVSSEDAGASAGADDRGLIRRQHPAVLIGAGVALFALVFAGTFFAIDFLKTDRQRTEDALDYSTQAIFEVQDGIAKARAQKLPFSFLQDLSEASGQLAGKVEDRERSYLAEVNDNPKLTEPASTVMTADADFLTSFGRLGSVGDRELRNGWRKIEREMTSARRMIEKERATIVTEVSEEPNLLPTRKSLQDSIQVAKKIVLAANAKLQAWFAKLRQLKNQCNQVKDFISSSSALVSEYRQQRSETGEFLSTPRLYWEAAVNGMNARADERDGLAERMSLEQPPLSASASWSTMIETVGESSASLRQAAEAFADGTIDSAPTWQRSQVVRPQFDAKSQEISARVDSTEASLDSSLATALDQTCNRKKPPRPAV